MPSKRTSQLAGFVLVLSLARDVPAQATSVPPSHNVHPPSKNPWAFSLITDGYIIPGQTSYANPNFTADRGWLHLEARYNSENFRTGSAWIGYNFAAGKKLILNVTPMIGGVFGRTNGIAPGCEASLTYKKVVASISNEYVFATDKSDSFYYNWPQFTYSPVNWLQLGFAAQRTKTYKTSLDTQLGFFVGFSHKKMEVTSYVFNPGLATPSVVLELGISF
ncbi:MAG TPA: hypothetical protein VK813_17485 [Edaphobacter sp.]|nr:hypothetical protein [Edaphobacter sp.]